MDEMARRVHTTAAIWKCAAIALSACICAQSVAQQPGPVIERAKSVSQQNGNFIVMPRNWPVSRRSGLWLYVDTRWVNGYGYRPVEVTICSPAPATADRIITVQLHCGWDSDVSAEQDFELPLGSTSASAIVAIPNYQQSMNCYWWEVWVDGIKDVDLSIKKEDAKRQFGGSGISVSTVRVLVPGLDAQHKSSTSTSTLDHEVLSLKLSGFPRRWIDYTCLDVVSLSIAELEQLSQTNPAAFAAIGRWVRAGGHLWVCEVGAKLEELPRVSKSLQLPGSLVQTTADSGARQPNESAPNKPDAADEDRPARSGWRPARTRGGAFAMGQAQGFTDNRTGQTRWVSDPRVIAALDRDPNYVRNGQTLDPTDETTPRSWTLDSSQWFLEQRVGLGMVRAFRGANEAATFARQGIVVNANSTANGDATAQVPRALAVALRSTRHWDARHGLIPDGGNPEFARLLVPGMGLAPVTEFQVLITVFVLLIGPLNYWLLKRYKRLQLLVLTVPIAAGAATAALFAYAAISDGFDTTVRVRSLTTLDQQTGEAACWARLSYYSGIAPGKGLVMPADVAMYPILPTWTSDNANTSRAMLWDANEVRLAQGWLNSRTPTQYLMQRSRKSPHHIEVTAGNGKMQVTNRLGTRIESLLAIDEKGKFFTGENVEDGARTILEPISRAQAVQRIVPVVRENEPEMPTALSGSDFRVGRRRGLFGRYVPQASGDQLRDNLADRAVTDLAGLNGRPALDLPARSYVAITASGPEVVTGIPHAEEQASFHVIVGSW
jgi:hypothetical protein